MKPNKKVMSDMVAKRSASSARPAPVSSAPDSGIVSKRKSVATHPSSPLVQPQQTENSESLVYRGVQAHAIQQKKSGRVPIEEESRKIGCALWIIVPICIIVLTLVLGGLVSGARISVTPQSWGGNVDLVTTFSLSASQGAPAGSSPFYTATKTFSESATVPATVGTSIAAYAEGTVRFYNRSNKSITIPAQSELTLTELAQGGTTSFVRYITTQTVSLGKGTEDKPAQKDVLVKAIKPGTMFNAQPTDFALIKPVDGVTIRGVTAISGGSDPADRIIDPELLAATQDDLRSRFDTNEALLGRIIEDVPPDMIALPISFTMSEPVVTIRPTLESAAVVTSEKTVTALLVERSVLAQLLGSQMGAPRDMRLTIDKLEGLTVVTTALGSADNIPNRLPVRITGVATVSGYVDTDAVIRKIVGKSKREVKALLEGALEIKQFDIHMIPFWRRILPLDANKISVTVLNP